MHNYTYIARARSYRSSPSCILKWEILTRPVLRGERNKPHTANLRTKILDFGGFDSGGILILRGGTLMSIGNFPQSLSQQILAGIILVGRLGVGSPMGAYKPVALWLHNTFSTVV